MIYYLTYAALVLGLTGIVVLSFFYRWKWRNACLITAFVLAALGSFSSIFVLLGKPLPLNYVTALLYHDVSEAKVLFFTYEENVSITLLFQIPNQKDPVLVKLPWSQQTAQRLQRMMAAVQGTEGEEGEGGEVIAKRPFNNSLETRPNDFQHQKPPRQNAIPKTPPRSERFQIQ